MAVFNLSINGSIEEIDVASNTPILWVLRDSLKLVGTKYGCGIAQCGACTIHLDGNAVRSCQLPISEIGKKEITTIEGLSDDGSHPVQNAWLEHDVPQCGYCQTGMIMAAAALLAKHSKPTDEQINEEITNICRCGTYNRVRAGIHQAAGRKA